MNVHLYNQAHNLAHRADLMSSFYKTQVFQLDKIEKQSLTPLLSNPIHNLVI